jgi:tripartite ATP-independent transporter DctM subunit
MSLEVMSLILIGGLLFLLAIGTEIYVAMGVMASFGLMFFLNQPLRQFSFSAFDIMNSFILTCQPLFIFMGTIFSATGIVQRLFIGADRMIAGLPGGVACSVLAANGIFGAISGSSVAAAATFGKIAFPEMERLGYNPKLALGSLAMGGTLSVLIPPSLLFIVYGSWQNVSVARLFAAGMIPGIVLTILLMLTVVVMVLINPSLAPRASEVSFRERVKALVDILPFLGVIVAVLGVIFAGIMTPTEAAALGCVLGIILAVAYRSMSFAALKESMWTAVKVNGMIAFVLFTARVLAQVFNHIGLTGAFSSLMLGLPLGKWGIFAAICVMYLVLGCFFDSMSMMVLTLPFVGPLLTKLGFDAIWFGVIFVILAEIGLVTPPFGLNLFVLHGVIPKYDLLTIAVSALPFLVPALLLIVVLVFLPQLALWLPGVIY